LSVKCKLAFEGYNKSSVKWIGISFYATRKIRILPSFFSLASIVCYRFVAQSEMHALPAWVGIESVVMQSSCHDLLYCFPCNIRSRFIRKEATKKHQYCLLTQEVIY
jgi:hypothetical protein